MKILILDEEFPFPTNTGKRTRSFQLHRRMAQRFQIRYVGHGDQSSEAARALRSQGLEPFAVPSRVPPKQGPAFYARLLANLLSPLPYIVTSHFSRTYHRVVQQCLAEFRPNVVLCEWTPYAIFVRGLSSPPIIVSAHNVEADIWQRYYQNEPPGPRRWYIREQWRKVKRFERAAMGWVDGVVVVSDLDGARFLGGHQRLSLKVVPNGVDLDYFSPLPPPAERNHLVFTGSMDWRPNQDAARYFVAEIFPLLKKARPDLQCTFVGRSPPPNILALAKNPGIHVTGTVDDVRPYVARAAVYIVPLRIGGGSRLKILEALAMGRAVVSTTVGAEGLDVEHDRHVSLADEPNIFAQSVLDLLQQPQRCAELALQGRRLVEAKYGWDALADTLAAFVSEIAVGKASSEATGPVSDSVAQDCGA